MSRRCGGNGLMFAGLIVMLIGLAVAGATALHIPGYWTPVLVGAVLFLVGALRQATQGNRPPADAERP
jgi:ribose/xylose/arabinose/galactoside ABC-type transport system permease subunit